MKNFRMAIVVLVAVLLVAVTEMGRTAVNRAADYREMTAPKSLHQLSQEARSDASQDSRGSVMLMGAGLAALVLVYAGVVVFALPAGREFGRAKGRRRARRNITQPGNPTTAPTLRVMPPAPRVPALPAAVAEEGRYEDIR